MDLWKIFVLGILRLNLNCDYDRLQSLANNYKTVREMLGHSVLDEDHYYQLQTLQDNVRLLIPEVLSEINQIVVSSGYKLLKKKETVKLAARCDSFVVKTDVHFSADISLLFDAVRKAIQLIAQLSNKHVVSVWRQHQYNIKMVKKAYCKAQQSKRGDIRDGYKKLNKIQKSHRSYIDLAESFLVKVFQTADQINKEKSLTLTEIANLMEIDEYIKHGIQQIDQIKRRVINGEVIPNNEKVF